MKKRPVAGGGGAAERAGVKARVEAPAVISRKVAA